MKQAFIWSNLRNREAVPVWGPPRWPRHELQTKGNEQSGKSGALTPRLDFVIFVGKWLIKLVLTQSDTIVT